MIVLKDGALSTAMREFDAMAKLEPKQRHTMTLNGRTQLFRWINDIEYDYGPNCKLLSEPCSVNPWAGNAFTTKRIRAPRYL